MEINVNVTAEKVVTDKKFVAAGNFKQIKLKLELSSDFDNMVVRVVLNNKSVTALNGECYLPPLKTGRYIFGIYGYSVEDGKLVKRVSPQPTYLVVTYGSFNDDSDTPTELEEFYQRINELVKSTSPVYKEVNELEFSDKDYSQPLDIKDMTIYKLSDTTPNFEGQDNIKITYGTSADNLRTKEMHLVTRKADYVEDDDSQLVSAIFYDDNPPDLSDDVNKDIETIVTTNVFEGVGDVPALLILYKSQDFFGDGTQFDKGIYIIMSPLTPDEEPLLYKLYKISTVKYHKIPPEFLPDISIDKTEIQEMIDNSIGAYLTSVLGGAS